MSLSLSNTKKRVLALVAAGLLSATAISATTMLSTPNAVQAQTQAQTQIQPQHQFAPNTGFADLAERVMPAVVSVQVRFTNTTDNQNVQQFNFDDLPQDSPFRDFFRNFPQFRFGTPDGQDQPGQPNRPRGMGQGSGFIISADGYAVTNNHVVRNADQVTVTDKDGNEYKADVIGSDPKTDIALIKINANKPLAYVAFSDVTPRVGDWVVAVGNPFGLGGTVTTGVVSALGRDIGSGPYDDFIQIDASINRGNSGGPAFNLSGQVIGMNTAIYSPSGGSVGIGFAIPAATVQDVVNSLKTTGTVTRGWLGVQIQPVNDDLAETLKLQGNKGAVVSDLTDNSPAQAAGLRTGDTILRLNGEEVADPRDLARKVARIQPGQNAELLISRNGQTQTLTVKIAKMPADQMAARTNPDDQPSSTSAGGELGLRLAPAEDGAGVRVVEVRPNSPAAERGLRTGDVILEVAGQQVNGVDDVRQAVAQARENEQNKVLMLIRSGENQRFVALPFDRG
jgi:serine protease Do